MQVDKLERKTQAYEWHMLLLSGDASKQDKEEFKQWLAESPLNEDEYNRAQTAWSAFGNIEYTDLEVVAKPDGRFKHAIDAISFFLKPILNPPIAMAALALVVIVAALFSYLSNGISEQPHIAEIQTAAFHTNLAETKSLTLFDGSVVTLDALSKISVRMDDKTRKIFLTQGALVIKAASDAERPMSIFADDVYATVIGTAFEMRNNGDVVRIAVVEGKVKVSKPYYIDGKASSAIDTKYLEVGDYVVTQKHTNIDSQGKIEVDSIGSWRHGRLEYEGATIREFVADLNRYSGKSVLMKGDFSNIDNITVTAFFDRSDIETMVNALPSMFPVVIEVDSDREIRVSPK